MEFYDSKEEEESSKNIAKKIKQVLDFVRGMTEAERKAFIETLIMAIKEAEVILMPLIEKAKKSKLNEEELLLFVKVSTEIKELMEKVETIQLVLGVSLKQSADKIFFHWKQEAEKGNAKAKELYDQCYPSYLASLEEKASEQENLN